MTALAAEAMTATERDGQWFVIEGGLTLAGPFASNATAWVWIDRYDPEHHRHVEKVARIRDAFAHR
jgi:hypothetical protein